MDIQNLNKNGSVERSLDRPARSSKAVKDVLIPQPPRDQASISSSSRATATMVETLGERARKDDSSRGALVAAALEKLAAGKLGSPEAVATAARQLLASDFLSA
ncbi:MAG: hypothetical protein K8J09_02525 [Planctomycetes bacterium]|nr:hypothetical protein [Planctomycetota bacterium]MCC7396798.1 hypothetical protein [Planctomycetota bacterium]